MTTEAARMALLTWVRERGVVSMLDATRWGRERGQNSVVTRNDIRALVARGLLRKTVTGGVRDLAWVEPA